MLTRIFWGLWKFNEGAGHRFEIRREDDHQLRMDGTWKDVTKRSIKVLGRFEGTRHALDDLDGE